MTTACTSTAVGSRSCTTSYDSKIEVSLQRYPSLPLSRIHPHVFIRATLLATILTVIKHRRKASIQLRDLSS